MRHLSLLSKMAVASVLAASFSTASAAACAPKCRAKCSASSAKCGAKGDPKLIKRPAGLKVKYSSTESSIHNGEALFKNTNLSTNGMSCATCHSGGASYQNSFAKPFPHKVEMAYTKYGVSSVYLDEAIQMCMLGPMASKPFDWNSAELANLVAFVSEEQKKFINQH